MKTSTRRRKFDTSQRLRRGALWLLENAVLCVASALLVFACLTLLESEGRAQGGGTTYNQIARGTTGQATPVTGEPPLPADGWTDSGAWSDCQSYYVPYAVGTWAINGWYPALARSAPGCYGGWSVSVGGQVTVPSNATPGEYTAQIIEANGWQPPGYPALGWRRRTYKFIVPAGTPTPTPTPTGTATGTPPPTGTGTGSPPPTGTGGGDPPPTGTGTGTPPPTGTTPPPPPSSVSWSPASQVGEIVNETTGAVTGYNGRMVKPQNQTGLTATPPTAATPQVVVVAPGEVVNCEVEAATDNDKKTVTINGVSTSTYPADGAVTYKWTAESVPVGGATGTFANNTSRTTTWTAPTTVGTYTLKCALDDPWTGTQTGVTLPETGSKNDKAADDSAPVVRSVTVYVARVWFTEDTNQKYGFDAWTNRGKPGEVPWKSVGVNQTDTVFGNISPAPAAPGVEFGSSDLTHFTVVPEPLQATSAKQKIPITGLLQPSQDAHVEARPAGKSTILPGSLNVAVYKRKRLNVGVVVVNESNGIINGADIPQTEIEAYVKKVYKQAVCNVTVFKMLPRTVSFDDGNGKLDIGYTETNGEQKLVWTTTEEQAIIDAFTAESIIYDRLVFLVAKPNLTNFAGVSGIMTNNVDQKYAFVFADNLPGATAKDKAGLVAHELGHSLGLAHTQEVDNAVTRTITSTILDADNIMHPLWDNIGTLDQLRKDLGRVNPSYADRDQWTTVNSNLKVESP